jgi:signal peptidase I
VQRRLFKRSVRTLGRTTGFFSIALSALLIFGTRGFSVYGCCMEPNLRTGERVLASRFSYWFNGPKRGDVVIFKYPADPSKNYVKRVVGLPGDEVEIREGRLSVNGTPLDEPYKLNEAHGDYGPEVVKAGNLFVLGDNRDQSNDSRYWGELPMANVQAKAVLLYWPLNRWHFIN